MMARKRINFAPVPWRAVIDERLTLRHLRVLMVIAYHDRLGKNGQGCWVSNRRIAELARLDYTVVADTISDLRRFGHITSEINPDNRNFRVHRIIYDEPTPIQSGGGTLGQSAKGSEGYPQQDEPKPFVYGQRVNPLSTDKPFVKMGVNPLSPHCGKSLNINPERASNIFPKDISKKERSLEVKVGGFREGNCAEAQQGKNCAEAQTSEEGREVKEATTYLANAESLLKSPSERTILRYEITKLTAMADDPGLPEHICERARELLIAARTMQ